MRVVVLDNLRSAWNVGSIFRTAAALKYDEIALCGVTITPPSRKLKETSRGVDDWMPWRSFADTASAIAHYRKSGLSIVALETGERAQPLAKMKARNDYAWVLGNEAKGIGEEILTSVDQVFALPILSEQASVNVSCAFAAAAYFVLLRD